MVNYSQQQQLFSLLGTPHKKKSGLAIVIFIIFVAVGVGIYFLVKKKNEKKKSSLYV